MFLQTIRTAYPAAQIAALRPFNGAHAADIQAEVSALQAAGDARVFYVDTIGWITPSTDTTDGIHPSAQGHQKVTAQLVPVLKNHL
jgi:lysophospholipase L1-like esterase